MTLLRTNRVFLTVPGWMLCAISHLTLCYKASFCLCLCQFSLTLYVLVVLLCCNTTSSAQSACRCSERKSSFGECESSAAGSNADAVKQCSVRLVFPCGGCSPSLTINQSINHFTFSVFGTHQGSQQTITGRMLNLNDTSHSMLF